jgi:hypothetical protein
MKNEKNFVAPGQATRAFQKLTLSEQKRYHELRETLGQSTLQTPAEQIRTWEDFHKHVETYERECRRSGIAYDRKARTPHDLERAGTPVPLDVFLPLPDDGVDHGEQSGRALAAVNRGASTHSTSCPSPR